jgi:hypothetical protein
MGNELRCFYSLSQKNGAQNWEISRRLGSRRRDKTHVSSVVMHRRLSDLLRSDRTFDKVGATRGVDQLSFIGEGVGTRGLPFTGVGPATPPSPFPSVQASMASGDHVADRLRAAYCDWLDGRFRACVILNGANRLCSMRDVCIPSLSQD